MFFRGVVIKTRNCLTLQCKLISQRALSSKPEVVTKAKETIPTVKERRFVKPKTSRELKPFDENFVVNLYKGQCNKEIFEYPLIYSRAELDSAVRQSLEVDEFLSSNSKIQIKSALEVLKKLELFGLSISQEYGGAGYGVTETKFLIECCGVNPNLARFLGYNDVGCKLIDKFGTEEQKKKYLPRLASGESRIALAYLETGPLVDFSSFEGCVIEDHEKNGFLINAKKKWVHSADTADLFLVLLKSSVIYDDDDALSKLGFGLFIVEKSIPGISIYQLVSGSAKEFNLFEVDFKNVFVPRENQLGTDPSQGNGRLQYALALRELTDATICTSLIKQMIQSALKYCEKKVINEVPVKNFEHIQTSIAYLSAFAYILESVVYLISARCDSHVEPNLFHEGILAKVLSVEMLQLAIDKYIQILGHDSFKKCELLEEALKALHHCSVFDENNTYLKLIISSAGVMSVKPSLVTFVKKIRKRYDYPIDALKFTLFRKPRKISECDPKLGIKGELNETFARTGDILDSCLGKIKTGIENHLIKYGSSAMEDEYTLVKYAEMVTYAYALIACLSRASTSFCYDLKNSDKEIHIVYLIGDIIEAKFEQLAKEAFYTLDFAVFYKEIGKSAFANKEYPAEHPLSRAF